MVGKLREEGRVDDAFERSFEAIRLVLEQMRQLQLKIHELQKSALGKTSERVDSEQLTLMLEEFSTLQAAMAAGEPVSTEAEALEDAVLDEELERERARQRAAAAGQGDSDGDREHKKKRGLDTSNVAVKHDVSDLSEAERTHPETGAVASLLGHDTVETLEYKPGHFRVVVTKVARYGFGGDGSAGIISAPSPVKLIPRAMAGTSVLADIIVGKHVDHLPLNRLHHRYLRAGLDIPRSTLAEWYAFALDALEPVARRLYERVLTATVIRIDASGLKVQDTKADGNITRGTMWCLVGDDRDVVFRYAEDGTGNNGPWQFLQGREDFVQADAANVFQRVYNGRVGNAKPVGCNAHARRKFIALMHQDQRVAHVVQLYGRLYKVERLAKMRGLDPDGVLALRRQHSASIVKKLYTWLARHAKDDPPDTSFSKAIAYAINHKTALTRFVEDGRLDIDNNLCERQIRALALGRKNFLFAGSHEAARRIAIGYSLTRSCAMHGVPPQPYLTDILTKLAGNWPQSRLDELLPDKWMKLHGAAVLTNAD